MYFVNIVNISITFVYNSKLKKQQLRYKNRQHAIIKMFFFVHTAHAAANVLMTSSLLRSFARLRSMDNMARLLHLLWDIVDLR